MVWTLFEGALSGGFGPACDGCVERTELSPRPGVGLWLGASVMLTTFSAAAAVASAILHPGSRHIGDSYGERASDLVDGRTERAVDEGAQA